MTPYYHIANESLKDILITAELSGQKIQKRKRVAEVAQAYQRLLTIDCFLLSGLPGVSSNAL